MCKKLYGDSLKWTLSPLGPKLGAGVTGVVFGSETAVKLFVSEESIVFTLHVPQSYVSQTSTSAPTSADPYFSIKRHNTKEIIYVFGHLEFAREYAAMKLSSVPRGALQFFNMGYIKSKRKLYGTYFVNETVVGSLIAKHILDTGKSFSFVRLIDSCRVVDQTKFADIVPDRKTRTKVTRFRELCGIEYERLDIVDMEEFCERCSYPDFQCTMVQILAAMECAQQTLKFKHMDFHMQNVVIVRVPPTAKFGASPPIGDCEKIAVQLAGEDDGYLEFDVPRESTSSKSAKLLVKILDYGLSTCEHRNLQVINLSLFMHRRDNVRTEWGEWNTSLEGEHGHDIQHFVGALHAALHNKPRNAVHGAPKKLAMLRMMLELMGGHPASKTFRPLHGAVSDVRPGELLRKCVPLLDPSAAVPRVNHDRTFVVTRLKNH